MWQELLGLNKHWQKEVAQNKRVKLTCMYSTHKGERNEYIKQFET